MSRRLRSLLLIPVTLAACFGGDPEPSCSRSSDIDDDQSSTGPQEFCDPDSSALLCDDFDHADAPTLSAALGEWNEETIEGQVSVAHTSNSATSPNALEVTLEGGGQYWRRASLSDYTIRVDLAFRDIPAVAGTEMVRVEGVDIEGEDVASSFATAAPRGPTRARAGPGVAPVAWEGAPRVAAGSAAQTRVVGVPAVRGVLAVWGVLALRRVLAVWGVLAEVVAWEAEGSAAPVAPTRAAPARRWSWCSNADRSAPGSGCSAPAAGFATRPST